MDTFMNIVNFVSQGFLMTVFFSLIFEPRLEKRLNFFLMFIWQSAVNLIGFFALYHFKYRVGIIIPLSFIVYAILFKGKFFKKIFFYFTILLMTVLADGLCFFIFEYGFGIKSKTLLMLEYRTFSTVIYLVIIYFIYGISFLIIKRAVIKLTPVQWFRFSIFPISQLIIIASYGSSMVYDPTDYNSTILFISALLSVVSNGYLYYLLTELTKKAQLEADAKFLEEKINMQYRHYQQLKDQMAITAKYRHDIVNHLETMQQMITNGSLESANSYMNQMREDFKKAKVLYYSDNPVLDAVLGSKSTVLEKNNIELQADYRLKEPLLIEEKDLVSVFGNLLDNAIEACCLLNDKPRKIFTECYTKAGMLVIKITNDYCIGEDNTAVKDNSHEHGLGLKIVEDICKKHGGFLTVLQDDGVFKVTAGLNCTE